MNRSAEQRRNFTWKNVPAYMGKNFTAIHLPPAKILKVTQMLKVGAQLKDITQATGISINSCRKVRFLMEKGVDVEGVSKQKITQRSQAAEATKEEAGLYPEGKAPHRKKRPENAICFFCKGVKHHYSNCATLFR